MIDIFSQVQKILRSMRSEIRRKLLHFGQKMRKKDKRQVLWQKNCTKISSVAARCLIVVLSVGGGVGLKLDDLFFGFHMIFFSNVQMVERST